MSNSSKIINYLNTLQHKFMLITTTPGSWWSMLAFGLIVLVSLLAAHKLKARISTRHFPYCVLRKITHNLLIVFGLLLYALADVIMRGHSNQIIILLTSIAIAATIINTIEAITSYVFTRRHFTSIFIRPLTWALWFAALIIITDSDDDIYDLLTGIKFHLSKHSIFSLWDVIHNLTIIISITIIALLLIRYSERRINHLQQIDTNIQQILARVSKIAIFTLAFMTTLPIIGIDVTTLSVFGGAIGVGIGFGLQKITSNFLSGFIILLDRSIKVGDRLVVDNNSGLVSKITTRYVVLERFDGTEILIPNETFITNNIQNQSYSNTQLRSELIFNVSANCDISQAINLISTVLEEAPNTLSSRSIVTISRLIDNGVEIKGYFWVSQPSFITDATNYIYINVLKLFQQHQITAPQASLELVKHASSN